ncbi:MAG: GTP-binding protein [Methylococcaceae bacterium]|nr:GTP-binding protein [Methylococcaceae bacterium]
MDCAYSNQLHSLRSWASSCLQQGFLSDELFQQIPIAFDELAISARDNNQQPPLLVAFMGGTGVGKSSLLNRLAGEAIATAGIERPTSREVTLFHHESVVLQHLAAALPLSTLNIHHHHDDENRHVIWLDMPDFDSIEVRHQQQVLEWLPHIDILIYVVSPERYRDRKAWELLLAEGGKHAWLFVMNQWDRGQPEQYADFHQQLAVAGFLNPVMFKTSCVLNANDDFAELVRQIHTLSGQVQRQLLLEFQNQRRYQELYACLEQFDHYFQKADFNHWQLHVNTIWQRSTTNLQQGLDWAIRETAQYVAENVGPLKTLEIWDPWAQNRLGDALDEIGLSASEFGFPDKQLRLELDAIGSKANKVFHHECEIALRRALMHPGNRLQKILLVLTALAETLLPLLAMAIVAYEVFVGFYQSSLEARAYLGVEFAVHSGLLIGLSWLIPFYLHRKLQPSRKTTAINGLKHGAELAFHLIGNDINSLCLKQAEQHSAHCQQLAGFKQACAKQFKQGIDDTEIQRLLSQHG